MAKGKKYENYIPEWKKLYEEGMSFRQIAKQFKVDAKTVNRTLEGEVEIRPKSQWLQYLDEWYELYMNGYTKIEISRKYNVNPTTVGKLLEKKGIPVNEVPSKRKYEELSKDFIDLYQKGYSLADIAEKYNIDKQTVSNYLERSGIDRRSLSESIRQYETNEYYFDDIDTKEKAYHLGLLYATGSLLEQHNGYAIQITTSKNTRYLIDPLVKVIRGSLEGYYLGEDEVYRVRINSEHLYHTLSSVGFSNRAGKKLPELNRNLYPAFIQGYFESRLSIDTKTTMHISGPKNLLEGIKKILVEDGSIEKSSIKMYTISETEHRMAIYKKTEIEKITEWLLFNSEIHTFRFKVEKTFVSGNI